MMGSTKERELPTSVIKMQGIRGSGAAGTHGDRRTRRLRDRGAKNRAAIREQMGR
jgi:hypothetical protein